MAKRLVRAGYFWPSLKIDAGMFVRKCVKCQIHGPLIHLPGEEISIVTAPCPFAQWGIDLVSPFPMVTRQRKFLVVAVDYFSKLVEAEPLANICCRFGLPRTIISDNGTQFNSAKIRAWCEDMHIEQRFTSVAHPEACHAS